MVELQGLFAGWVKKERCLNESVFWNCWWGFGKTKNVGTKWVGGWGLVGARAGGVGIAGGFGRVGKVWVEGRGFRYDATLVVRARGVWFPSALRCPTQLTCGAHARAQACAQDRRSLRRSGVLAGRCAGLRVVVGEHVGRSWRGAGAHRRQPTRAGVVAEKGNAPCLVGRLCVSIVLAIVGG
jgi:hypothetical protein